ncbi:MAG: tetratricopeptide repeat protein [Candidatus Muiribacteriaceae bacterium]
MKKLSVFFIVLFLYIAVSADFEKAVSAYDQGRYSEALELFTESGGSDEHTYYNIGNCHYRLGNIPEASAYYLKALLINPGFSEAFHNLCLTSSMNERTISSYFIPFNKNIAYLIFSIFLTAFIVYYLFAVLFKKKNTVLFSILLVFFILSSIYAGGVYVWSARYKPVVTREEVVIYSSPSESAPHIGRFFKAAVLDVDERGSNFYKVTDTGGLSGWVKKEKLIDLTDLK